MSVKVTSNGRSTLSELQDKFNKVYIKYNKNQNGTATVIAALVSNNVVHIGISKFSNRTYNFSKSKGRAIALGRAELAYNIYKNIEFTRSSKHKRRQELSFSIMATSDNSVENIVDAFVGIKPKTTVNS
jgi:hypothetical protein